MHVYCLNAPCFFLAHRSLFCYFSFKHLLNGVLKGAAFVNTDELMLKVFQRFLDVTEESFLIVDKDGRIADINERYYNTLHIRSSKTRKELVGIPVTDLLPNTALIDLLLQKGPAQLNQDMFLSGPELSSEFNKPEIAVRTCANVLDDNGQVIAAFAHVKTNPQIRQISWMG